MIDFEKLNKLPYITKRMYMIKNICEFKKVDLEYLFGLFNLYNRKNSGRWFWQKAAFTGMLKDAYDNFNTVVDKIIKDLKQADEKKTKEQIKSASKIFDKLIVGLEMNCNVNRENDFNNVKGYLEKNFRELINDNLRRIK
ncbi:MAG: hypothetical protein KJ821_07125 [Actinobacteria bacterium]|nr:hypothetical protein [Actinomycetota bacterium]